MDNMDNAELRAKTLAVLFGAFGQAGETKRMKIYMEFTETIPAVVLEKTCKKLVAEARFLPTIAEITDAAAEIIGETNEGLRVKPWNEAWGEIERAMQATPWGKTPQFSTPEIAQAVNSFGWLPLQSSLAEDMPTVRAQMRRFYEDACSRSKSKAKSDYALGRNPAGILGIPKQKIENRSSELTSVNDIMGKMLS